MGRQQVREGVYVRPIAFTVAPYHLEKLETMKQQLGLSRSEIVRQLIEGAELELLKQPTS